MRSAAPWAYAFGIFVASSAVGYAATYKTLAERQRLANTFGQNSGVDALIGRAHDIQTVAGFTVWRSLGVLSVVGAVWGVLASTRLLRGEEEAGRWELVLAGRTTRGRAAAEALGGLGAGAATFFLVTAVVITLVGHLSKVHIDPGSALFFALALVASPTMFLSLGGLMSQMGATRRRAAAYGGALVGSSYAIRLIADSAPRFGWLRWASPLGWVEQLQPVGRENPLALIPIFGLVALSAALTVWSASKRDLGASIVHDRASAKPRLRLLSGLGGLEVRLSRATIAGWLFAIGGLSLVVGFIAKAAGSTITGSPTARQAIARLGDTGSGARLFLGLTFLIVGMLIALLAVSQVVAARGSEADGEIENEPAWV